MNWIEGINEAIKYIEANLTNDLKMEEIAERAYASVAYFQKSFALLCGFTVGEYIRNRRLASAGNDLLTTDEKVIDIALKYGYDSTDSFTKAFTRFHGVTPSSVRKNGHPVKTFAPLKLELFMKGGYIMDYSIRKQEAFSIKVKVDKEKETINYLDDGTLPEFLWFSLGLYYQEMPACSVYKADSDVPADDFETITLPEHSWAVFKCSGENRTNARESTWEKIKNEWLPQTRYELLSPNYIMVNYADEKAGFGEIMIAVKERK